MHIFTVTILQATKAGLGTVTKCKCVQSYIQFSKYFTGWLGRSESLYIEKRQSKSAHF